MDMTILVSIIGWILAPVTTYVIAKTMLNRQHIMNILFDIIDETKINKDFQQDLLFIGALVGSGIRTGLGLTKPKGKSGIEGLIVDIISQIAPSYISKFVGKQQENPEENPFAQR